MFSKNALLKILQYSKETPEQVFFCEYCEILTNSFFIEHLWWLFLNALMENTNVKIFDHIIF